MQIGAAWEGITDTGWVLHACHYTRLRGATGEGRFGDTRWVLDYAFAPCGRYRLGEGNADWRVREARTAHLYAPGTVYWEDGEGAPGRHSGFFIFTGGDGAALRAWTRGAGYAEFTDPLGVLGDCIREGVQAGQHEGSRGHLEALSYLYRALALLHGAVHQKGPHYEVGSTSTPRGEASFADAVDAYLRRALGERVRLSDVARAVHMSPSTLSHRYHRETGQTPMRRLRQLRMDLAKALLHKGYNLDHIAEATGHCDGFHLSRVFKQAEGMAPRDYLAARNPRR